MKNNYRPIILLQRIINKIVREYRKQCFISSTNCKHRDFLLVGNVHLINKNVQIGHGVTIYPDCQFFGDGKIIIGDNSELGNNTIIYASKNGGVSIGNNTLIAAQCYIIDADHGICSGELIRRQNNTVSRIEIGNDVWLGTNVTVLKGSNINDGAIIGAKSLVKGNVAPNSISVGIPCRHLKYRSND